MHPIWKETKFQNRVDTPGGPEKAIMGLNWSKLAKLVKMSQICYNVIGTKADYPKQCIRYGRKPNFKTE